MTDAAISSVRRTAVLLSITILTLLGAAPAGARQLSITTAWPPNRSVLHGTISWHVKVTPSAGVVAFSIDGRVRRRDARPPYRYSARLAPGTHILRATAVRRGSRAVTQVRVTVRGAADPDPRLYWGAYMAGETYSAMLGGHWGDAPWSSATWDRFEANAGKRVSIVHYGQPPPWERGFDPAPGNLAYSRGAIPAFDISTGTTSLRDIAAGKYDAAIDTWAKGARKWGRAFFLIPDVEMNGAWEPYGPGVAGNTPADFVAAWRHMHQVVQAAGATNVTWVWCPNVDPRHKLVPFEALYPGDDYVDWTGMDGYNQDGRSSFSWLFSDGYKRLLALAPAKPIMISQTSSVDEGKAAWITDALTQLPSRFPRIKAFVWFNWRINENGSWWPWQIESSPAAQTAFAGGIGSSAYAAGGTFQLPKALTKIGPP
jgi:hypothetical protein